MDLPEVVFTPKDSLVTTLIGKVRVVLKEKQPERLPEFEKEAGCLKCYTDCMRICHKYCTVIEQR